MNKVVEIVKNALINNRSLLSEEIANIVKIMCDYYEIGDYVNEVKFDYYRKNNHIAHYDAISKSIYFNISMMHEQLFFKYQNESFKYSFNEYMIIQILLVIIHELRHAIQDKKVNSEDNDIETLIICDCCFQRLLVSFNNYLLGYDLNPLERDAEIFAIKNMLSIIEQCQFFSSDTICNLKKIYLVKLLDGYKPPSFTTSRLSDYYEMVIGDLKLYQNYLSKISDMPTSTKMSLGLPIDNKDRINIFLAIKALDKNSQINDILDSPKRKIK